MQIGLPVVLFAIRSMNIVGMAKKKEAKLAAAKESKGMTEMQNLDAKKDDDPSKEKKEWIGWFTEAQGDLTKLQVQIDKKLVE